MVPGKVLPGRTAVVSTIIEKIERKDLHLAIIGLGYVGLPLAVEFAEAGIHTTGIDLDTSKVDQVNAGQSYVQDVPGPRLARAVSQHHLSATADFAVLRDVDCVCICVPTPLSKTKDPDISYIVAACEQIVRYLHPGMLVVLESTTYPGTTTEVILPRLAASGAQVGQDFFLAFSPERVDPGNHTWQTRNTPKVIGGVTPECTRAAIALYQNAVDTLVPVSSPAAAEMVKLLENTFRAVNIGLVNEVALICDRLGLNVWEIIEAAATKPFGFMKFTPGPGLGGHCIPIDPLYLSWKMRGLDYETRFIDLADKVNSSMPHHVVQKVMDALNDEGKALKGSRVLVLGVAYKAGINDVRESPALDIIELLRAKGAKVAYNDPHVPRLPMELGADMHSVELDEERLAWADCVVVATSHAGYDWERIGRQAQLVVDTRNAFKGHLGPARVVRL
ncbi:MAG: nucleotide sugar dehydrogenase [Candidatus Latescibacteria bacterium]|nr:nucleotide sugar dehydrogenase [Candidatus Latescibacterota bacterium]